MSESIQQLQLAGLCAQAETPFIVGIFLLLAFIIVWMLLQHRAQARQAGKIEDAQKEAEKILRQAQEEAGLLRKNTKLENDVILKEARIRAKEEVISAKEEFENSCTQRKNELQKAEQRLENKEDNLDKKMQQAERRLEELEKRDLQLRQEREKLQQSQNELEAKSRQHIQELERVANLSQEEARDMLLQRLEESLESERGSYDNAAFRRKVNSGSCKKARRS